MGKVNRASLRRASGNFVALKVLRSSPVLLDARRISYGYLTCADTYFPCILRISDYRGGVLSKYEHVVAVKGS